MIKKILQFLKGHFIQSYRGQTMFDLVATIYDFFNSATWYNDMMASQSREKIKNYKNKYKGKRCFIIGNGPSLIRSNLGLLKNEYTLGLNRIYILFDKIDFKTTFLVSINGLILKQSYKEIEKLKMPKFIGWTSKKLVKQDRHTIYMRSLVKQQFSKDCSKGMWEGATVTYVALQLAYYMGFEKVYLVGVDHFFKRKGSPHMEVISTGDDVDHFSPEYFGKGFSWHLPDLKTSEFAYKLAKKSFEEDARKIYDTTVGGKLKVFPKIKMESLFTK